MTEVLFSIEEGNSRFNSLEEDLEHISDHILADRLKHLEQKELVNKICIPGNPSKTVYALTSKGEELSEILGGLCDFAESKMLFSSTN